MSVAEIWKESLLAKNDFLYNYKSIKDLPSEWTEKNIILTRDVSRFSGRYSYNLTPYCVEIINRLHPKDSTRIIAIMKGAQSGLTQGVILPGMSWIIDQNPDNFLFTASDKEIAQRTIRERFDPMMESSGLKHLIRPNSVRAKGQRSGDTDFSKEFAGGNAIIEGTKNAGKFRFFSVKTVFMDDFDNAPRSDKTEGSVRKLVEGRQTSYGNIAKTVYCSTPTVQQTSNIYEMFLQGDQRKWHWPCPGCGTYIPVDWRIENEDGSYSGIVWELDDEKNLIEESVHFRCPCCSEKIYQNQKYELNLLGQWIPTAKPKDKNIVSYYLNSIVIPPGFLGWVDLVKEWLEACPPGQKPKADLLKVFNNVRLGLPFEEKGEAPKVMQIMENVRDYKIGIIPDKTSEEDGNGRILLITLAADLGGLMKPDNEDVRVDWEILAHSAYGATYSIDHGSIGTFKRSRKRKKEGEEKNRKKYTYSHGMRNSVWPLLHDIIKAPLKSESGEIYKVNLSLVDTGHFTKQAYGFVRKYHDSDNWIFGVKGVPEINFRRNTKDSPRVRKSPNKPQLYLLDVEQLKDELAESMKLKMTDEGTQEDGFMNYPLPSGKKYSLPHYFKQYQSEVRKEVSEGGEVVGFKWEKKNSDVENHFWDVRIYNNAARYVFIDLIKRTNPTKYKALSWETFASISEED